MKEKEALRQKSEKEHLELVELKEKYEQLFPIKRNKDKKATSNFQTTGIANDMASNAGYDTPQ